MIRNVNANTADVLQVCQLLIIIVYYTSVQAFANQQ